MAQKITVTLEDDLDGGPAVETMSFGLDGSEYEIDLSKKNADHLRKTLAPFIDHGRRATARAGPPGSPSRFDPSAQRRHSCLGQGARHFSQRTRADTSQRG